MKLIKQTKLVFAEGRSEKVYEVDLCEVGANQFVVNFRYGKRGSALKDGSKTVAPVKREEADRVFAKLVKDKVDSGYVDEASAPAARPPVAAAPPQPASPPPPAAPGSVPISRDPRAQKVLERLSASGTDRRWFRAGQSRSTWPLERAIWRAGELRIREAEPILIGLIGTATSTEISGGGKGMRDYCIAWALGRCGSNAAMRPLTQMFGNARLPEHVRRIAAESLMLLGDAESTEEFKADRVGKLPAPLKTAALGGDPQAFIAALDGFPLHQQPAVLHELYLCDTPTTRAGFLDALRKAPFRMPLFQHLRAIFKAAELRRDARVFGIFAYRFETTQANYKRSYRRRTEPYSSVTRLYFRRRIWRTLRRMGAVGDPDYVKLAAGVLLPFTDKDAVGPKQSYGHVQWGAWAPYHAFNHILYGNSSRFEAASSGRWRMKRQMRGGGGAPASREEAWPALWEQQPGALMQLCAESACTPVHEFAGKALLACRAFLDQLDDDDVVMLLERPYEATAHVGFVVAQKRYDATNPNFRIIAAAAACADAGGRAQAFKWIDEQRTRALADSALLASLVTAKAPDARAFARRLLRSSTLSPQVGEILIGRLVAALLALSSEDDNAIAMDAAQTMSQTLASHLGIVGAAIIRDLLAHPLSGVQELGAELLLRHDSRTGLIPADLILGVLHSQYENVRAVGMRLIGELPDAALATMDQLLLRLATDSNADIRNASRPLVARIAAAYPATRDLIVLGLVEALLRRRLAEDVPSHVLRVLTEDLAGGHAQLDTPTIWRLLSSGSPHAQELGGILLAKNVKPSELELDQLVQLASHEILSVRQAAWNAYEHDLARVAAHMASAVRILDAKWEDSRRWAMAFFRRPDFAKQHFTAEVLVGVIDSVREDVQAYGRELLQHHFDDSDGPELLLRLSEHPARSVQLFATNYLERFATGKPERLDSLMPYFASVLSRVNQGRIAKHRVLEFLKVEGSRDPAYASIVIPLLHRLAATISIEYRAFAIEAMMTIHRARPEVPLPTSLRVKPARVVTPPPVGGAR